MSSTYLTWHWINATFQCKFGALNKKDDIWSCDVSDHADGVVAEYKSAEHGICLRWPYSNWFLIKEKRYNDLKIRIGESIIIINLRKIMELQSKTACPWEVSSVNAKPSSSKGVTLEVWSVFSFSSYFISAFFRTSRHCIVMLKAAVNSEWRHFLAGRIVDMKWVYPLLRDCGKCRRDQ